MSDTRTYNIRPYRWYNNERPWGVFRDPTGVGISTCLYTAPTRRQCEDWLRTQLHQRRLPEGEDR